MESEKQNKLANKTNRLIDAENKLMVARWKGSGEMGEKRARIKMYTLLVITIVTGM